MYSSSSVGHVAELLVPRPRGPRYNAIPLPEAPKLDASVAYVATRSSISNTFARYQNAEEKKRESMTCSSPPARQVRMIHLDLRLGTFPQPDVQEQAFFNLCMRERRI